LRFVWGFVILLQIHISLLHRIWRVKFRFKERSLLRAVILIVSFMLQQYFYWSLYDRNVFWWSICSKFKHANLVLLFDFFHKCVKVHIFIIIVDTIVLLLFINEIRVLLKLNRIDALNFFINLFYILIITRDIFFD